MATTALVLAGAASPALAANGNNEAPQVAQVAAERTDFDIPAQPLAGALIAFGQQSGLQVAVDPAAVDGLASPGATGAMAPTDALRELLSGTGMTWRMADARTVALEKVAVTGAMQLDPVTVTGTRAERHLSTIPGSVSVIGQAEIQKQASISRNIGDILRQHVPGFVGENETNQENTTIRGRGALVLVNGVPQNQQLRTAGYDYRNIDPSLIERIEVVRGANAVYGFGGTGGIINIITKRAESEVPEFTTRVRTTFAPYNLTDDSFTREFYQDVQGQYGALDYFAGVSLRDLPSAFDARGNQIPDSNTEYNDTIGDINASLGWKIDPNQELRFTANYFHQQENKSYEPVGGVVGQRVADPVPTQSVWPNWLPTGKFSDPQQSTNLNASYARGDVLGGDMKLETFLQRWQLEYQTTLNAVPFGGTGREPGVHEREDRRIGARLTFDTPVDKIIPLEGARLTWGTDYLNYSSSELNVFSTRNVKTGFRPDITQNSYAVFGQAELPVGDFLFTGGVRHEAFRVNVDSMVKDNGTAFQGGRLSYGTTLANAGAVYFLSDTTELFGGYSQGFDVTQVGRAAAQVNSVSAIAVEPAITDQFEVGIRHRGAAWQGSLSTFYTTSELASRTVPSANGIAAPLRQPEEIWGAEATLDVQPFDQWGFGGSLMLQDGDREVNGATQPIQSWYITPVRLTGYAEYQATDDWFNRLQFTLTPGHDRFSGSTAWGEGKVDTVFLVDYMAEVAAGPGTVELGVRNLLNAQYVPAARQATNGAGQYYAGQGTTVSLGYKINW